MIGWRLPTRVFSLALTCLCSFSLIGLPVYALHADVQAQRLAAGKVVIHHSKTNNIDFVTGKISIDAPMDKVWNILVNPYEFETISNKMTVERVTSDKSDSSIMQCKIEPGFFLPPIRYTVDSKYDHGRSIQFHSVAGDIKDFRGQWLVEPGSEPGKTHVSYSMHVNPGWPIPRWLVQEGVKSELPKTLKALKQRIHEITSGSRLPVVKNITAGKVLLAPPV